MHYPGAALPWMQKASEWGTNPSTPVAYPIASSLKPAARVRPYGTCSTAVNEVNLNIYININIQHLIQQLYNQNDSFLQFVPHIFRPSHGCPQANLQQKNTVMAECVKDVRMWGQKYLVFS